MKAEIITVGTELLLFAHGNLNGEYINERLGKLGIRVEFRTRVGDVLENIELIIRCSMERSELVVISGGISLSENDLTREALARAVGSELKRDPKLLEKVRKKMESRGIELSENWERIVMLPVGAEPLENKAGVVPGIFMKYKRAIVVCMPGSLREIESILSSSFIQKMKPFLKGTMFFRKTFRIHGLTELEVESKVKDLYGTEGFTFTTLSSLGQVELNFIIEGDSEAQIEKSAHKIDGEIRKRLGVDIFGEDSDTLESVVGKMLTEKRLRLSVAESCTGGLLAKRITDIPGSSNYFLGGLVSYSDDAKARYLGIPEKDIKEFGAISQEIAREMAVQAREKSQSDIAVSITGVAGPEGGTIDRPVGLVYIGIADAAGVTVEKRTYSGDRIQIRKMAVQSSLDLLRRRLLSRK